MRIRTSVKIATLSFGFILLALLCASAPAQAQWCQDINGAYWCGDPSACEGVCSQSGSDCTTECSRFGEWSTCGAGGDDNDSDGVADSSDNCVCAYNPNQANCDGDSLGDACDPQSAVWVFVQDLGECDIDRHATGTEWDVQRMGALRYRNLCDNTYCSDRYVIEEKSCTFSFWGCGKSYSHCCECWWDYNTCHQQNTCGGPDCPF